MSDHKLLYPPTVAAGSDRQHSEAERSQELGSRHESSQQKVYHSYPLAVATFNERRQQWQILAESPLEPISKFFDTEAEAWDNALRYAEMQELLERSAL